MVAYPDEIETSHDAGLRRRSARTGRVFHVHRVEDTVARVVGIEQEVGEPGGEVALEGELREQAGPRAEPVEVEIDGELLRLLVEDVERAVEIVDEEAAAAGLVAHEVDPGQLPSRVLPVQLARDRQLRVGFELEGQSRDRLRRECTGDRDGHDGGTQNGIPCFIARVTDLLYAPCRPRRLAPGLRSDGPFPESNGAVEPSFRTGPDTRTEAMTEATVSMELDFCTRPAECRNPPFHDGWRSDSVVLADDDEGGRLVRRHVRMARVGNHHG